MSSPTVTASDGTALPLADLPTAIAYSGNLVTTLTVQYPNHVTGVLTTYVLTFTYSGNLVTNISNWVAQP